MSFSPIVPLPGLAGWDFLNRTRGTQQAAHDAQPRIERNVEAFTSRIATIRTAADLVADRQIMEVALGAFGLDEDIGSKYFIEQILSSDLSDSTSLASRFTDKRYQSLAAAFGFGAPDGPYTNDTSFAADIVSAYKGRQFEISIGDTAPDMRLALGFERDLKDIAAGTGSNDAKWFNVMANSPVRNVIQTALGLPVSFASLDLDQQLGEFKSRSQKVFGTANVIDLSTPENVEEIIDRFLTRSQIEELASSSLSGASVALALLQS